ESSIKPYLEKLDAISAMQLIIVCLAYTQIDPLQIRVEPFANRLKVNIKTISEKFNINIEAIRPIATIENDLLKTLSKTN
ncbi:hypothetical protein, partial [Pseudomonas umsongensis]|uniref:hypothetical protein n=1 Tax=Pseudomonas umsongensis TaxID=198618 RepID=UPI00200B287F